MRRAPPIRHVHEAVRRALRCAGVDAGQGVVVACSHGPDSLALADAVLALRRPLGLGAVTLVYVDHGLRPEALAEGQAVEALAAAENAAARVVPVVVDRRRGRGLEEAARAARYAALDAVADEVEARWILIGHTASDQAETVLQRLLRGAGVAGLAGMPRRRGRYLRPLLDVDRAAVEAYLAARGLGPSRDASNDEPTFQRNRLRRALLPALRAENPSVEAALARAAGALREAAEALEWAADVAAPAAAVREGPAEMRLSASGLAGLPPAVAKRLLARAAAGLGAALEARHLDALLAAARRPPRGTRLLSVPRIAARREYDDLVLARRQPAHLAVAVLDVQGDDGPYVIRTWQPGDRMRPAGLGGRSRKLQDLYTDRKIPRAARQRALVVARADDGEILWAQHVGLAAGARVRVSVATDARAGAPDASQDDGVTRGLLDE